MDCKLSTEIGSIADIIGEEKAVEAVAKAGFNAWDFTMVKLVNYNWQKGCVEKPNIPLVNNPYGLAKRLRKIGEDNGIVCNQSHAPFPVSVKEIKDSLKLAIELTAIAGGNVCVIHPDNNAFIERNTELYLELLPFAKEHGVKIVAENMWNWDNDLDQAKVCACSDKKNFCEQMQAIKDDNFGACLDVGHAEMKGLNTSATELVYALSERLIALHIHDTDKRHDNHTIPFTMNIDFYPIIKALKDIGYSGYFTLESLNYLSLKKYGASDVQKGVNEMYASGKKLADLYNGIK